MEPDVQDKTPELRNCTEGLQLTLANVPASFLVSAGGHGAELIVLEGKGRKEAHRSLFFFRT